MVVGEEVIPKHIITAWFGRGQKSDLFKRCLDSWRTLLPDWEHFEINEDTIGSLWMNTSYMKSVLERGEFVKATELARLVGLWSLGGIYADADVELIKDPTPLLDAPFFIGREDASTINGAVMGSLRHGKTVSELIFAFPTGSKGTEKATAYGPTFLTENLKASDALIHPPEFFYPYHWLQKPDEAVITPNTYAIHHWSGSWKGYK